MFVKRYFVEFFTAILIVTPHSSVRAALFHNTYSYTEISSASASDWISCARECSRANGCLSFSIETGVCKVSDERTAGIYRKYAWGSSASFPYAELENATIICEDEAICIEGVEIFNGSSSDIVQEVTDLCSGRQECPLKFLSVAELTDNSSSLSIEYKCNSEVDACYENFASNLTEVTEIENSVGMVPGRCVYMRGKLIGTNNLFLNLVTQDKNWIPLHLKMMYGLFTINSNVAGWGVQIDTETPPDLQEGDDVTVKITSTQTDFLISVNGVSLQMAHRYQALEDIWYLFPGDGCDWDEISF